MKILIKYIILCCVCYATQCTYCQIPSYYQYETSNGLPSNEIYDVKQDQQGFLWLGTEAGLVRYDGTRFKLYNCNQSRGSAISCLREDKLGRIWCTNFSGQIFYVNADTLTLFIPFEKIYKTHYAEIDFDVEGNLIITSGVNRIYKYNINTLKLIEIGNNDSLVLLFPYSGFNNQLLVSQQATAAQLLSLSNNKLSEIYFESEIKKQTNYHFFNRFILSNSFKNKQTLCFPQFNPSKPFPYLFYFHENKMKYHFATKYLQQNNIYPQYVYDDDDGNLFVGTTTQLLWLKKKNDQEWNLFARIFTGNSVSCIRKDREQNIWIGTLKNGLYKIPNVNLFNLNIEGLHPKSIGVNHLATDGKNHIYGSNLSGEVFDFDKINHQLLAVKTNEFRDVQALKYDTHSKQLFISQTNLFKYDPSKKSVNKGSFYLSNTKDLVFMPNDVYYKATGILEVVTHEKNSAAINTILSLYDTIYHDYYNNVIDPLGYIHLVLREQRCQTLCYASDTKILWTGFIDGLTFIKNKQLHFVTQPNSSQPIIATQIINDTIQHKLYVATNKQGIVIISGEKIIAQINTSNGLLSNNIKSFRLYKNMLWLVHTNKIQSYDLQTKQSKIIDMQDGLLSNELYDVEVLHDTVYVASSKGVQYFPANIQTHNSVVPVSLIQSFAVDDKVYNLLSPIKLSASTKNVIINLQGVALKSNGSLQYQYRLLPNDTNWITVASNENTVRYSSLSSNSYTFESRVLNEDGVASEGTSQVYFTINNPWWLQWWFLILAAIFLMLAGFFVYQYQANKKQKKMQDDLEKTKLSEELRRSQLASLKSQMNPHFLFNALNSIQEFIILNDKQQANVYMGKFADLMRMTLEMSARDEINLEDELVILNLYLELEALRFEEKFSYQIIVDNAIKINTIYIPAMLVQPYIENAVKHGLLHKQGLKNVAIYFSLKDEQTLCVKIIDNGIGRKRSEEINSLRKKKYTSFATGATQNRLELLNTKSIGNISVIFNDLNDELNNAVGTEVIIQIPI